MFLLYHSEGCDIYGGDFCEYKINDLYTTHAVVYSAGSPHDASVKLYAMDHFNDYKMVENWFIVEQAHEIQIMAKVLELLKCVLPNKFVMECIVTKLPHLWRNFSTYLKHHDADGVDI
jgi:hypothetical protein